MPFSSSSVTGLDGKQIRYDNYDSVGRIVTPQGRGFDKKMIRHNVQCTALPEDLDTKLKEIASGISNELSWEFVETLEGEYEITLTWKVSRYYSERSYHKFFLLVTTPVKMYPNNERK